MVELRDVVDEVIDLKDVFFPKDKSKCVHIALDDTFIPIKEGNKLIGCIAKCANCGELVEYHCPCACGATEVDPETGQIYTMLACDLQKNKRFVKGLKKWQPLGRKRE